MLLFEIQVGIDSSAAVTVVRNEKLQVLCGSGGGSVRERHESRCVLPLLRRRYPSVCVPRGTRNEIGAGTDQGHDDHDCKFRVLEACRTVSVSPAGRDMVSRRWW